MAELSNCNSLIEELRSQNLSTEELLLVCAQNAQAAMFFKERADILESENKKLREVYELFENECLRSEELLGTVDRLLTKNQELLKDKDNCISSTIQLATAGALGAVRKVRQEQKTKRTEIASHAAKTKHAKSATNKQHMKEAWLSGTHPSKNRCADVEAPKLFISPRTARKYLINLPNKR